MTNAEAAEMLFVWTPFLAQGFAWNIVISLAAMAIGTPIGIFLAQLRLSGSRAASWLTAMARLPPTFVLLFYFAYLLPGEFAFGNLKVEVPAWLKASLALSVAVVGFVSDNAQPCIRHLRRGERLEALYFIPAWTTYFLIIVMASSTASVIGVPELVNRANTVIAAAGEHAATLWVYSYAMLWFLGFCLPLSWLMNWLRVGLAAQGNNVDPSGANVKVAVRADGRADQ
ncbi:hypothetical protein [Aquamicrobium zhengzhouense]|uniref:Polar amino acid ABC transporter permease n=1 Tax=Aquamicrobium zhengzhouense TaxID=2781738 RepID=A0ABS0SGR7_9HYPH|nr:hypothetical protein [Aquamicrobium zhengzhouense]MBI1621775.1 polar amino acid ABC transporter permease [Aquamicrobium zhengzhouense]